MMFEINPIDWKELDPISKQCILEDYQDSLEIEGHSKENIDIECEMLLYELEKYD